MLCWALTPKITGWTLVYQTELTAASVADRDETTSSDEVFAAPAEPIKSVWNSLELAKLLVSLVTPIVVLFLGLMITDASKRSEDLRSEQIRAAEALRLRQNAVIDLSRFIYERRVRAEVFSSAMLRSAAAPVSESKNEILERKKAYDAAFVNWNTNSQAILLQVRATIQLQSYSYFESLIENRLVRQAFTPLDRCLTQAYDIAVRDGDPRTPLSDCKSRALIQRSLDCGYAITNGIYLASWNIDPQGFISKEVVDAIDRRCPDQSPKENSGMP
jgi:hypothetical protein